MSLLTFFEWCEGSAVGHAIRSSQWLFPVIESVHLLGLALMGGAVLVVDMRLFGLGLRRQPVAQLARDAQPWLIGCRSLFDGLLGQLEMLGQENHVARASSDLDARHLALISQPGHLLLG